MDDIDKANDHIQKTEDATIAAIRKAAADIPEGKPGDCDLCGNWSSRLVDGVCAPCRDKYKI